jgi:hypothetical protein
MRTYHRASFVAIGVTLLLAAVIAWYFSTMGVATYQGVRWPRPPPPSARSACRLSQGSRRRDAATGRGDGTRRPDSGVGWDCRQGASQSQPDRTVGT